jgi:O-antigen ligase
MAMAGLFAGGLAVGLLLFTSTFRTIFMVAALPAGAFVLGFPHAGLYMLSGAMLAQWPGQVLKLAGLAVGGAALLWVLARRQSFIPHDALFFVVGLFVAMFCLSAYFIRDAESMRLAFSHIGYLLYFWTVLVLATSEKVPLRLAGALLITCVLLAIIGFIQYRFPFLSVVSATAQSTYAQYGDAIEIQSWEGVFRIDSLTGSENYMGVVMQLAIPFAVLWTFRQRSSLRIAIGAGMTLALVGALFLSLTRGAMLIAGGVVVPLLIWKIGVRRSLPFVVLGGLVALAGVAAWEPLRERLVSTVTELMSGDIDTAGGWRREVIPIGFRMFLDNFWTGVGSGQHREYWRRNAPSEHLSVLEGAQLQFHNGYLTIAVEFGIVGVVLLLLLLFMGWWYVRRVQPHLRATNQTMLLTVAWAAEIAWIAIICDILVYPFFDGAFRMHWLVLGIIGALHRVVHDQRRQGEQEGALHAHEASRAAEG